MSIEHQLTETVEVKRLGFVGATNKKEFSTHIATLPCHIQPLDSAETQDIPGGFGKDFLLFCESADIREGDRIERTVGEETIEYRITGLESYNFMGNAHMELTIRTFEK